MLCTDLEPAVQELWARGQVGVSVFGARARVRMRLQVRCTCHCTVRRLGYQDVRPRAPPWLTSCMIRMPSLR